MQEATKNKLEAVGAVIAGIAAVVALIATGLSIGWLVGSGAGLLTEKAPTGPTPAVALLNNFTSVSFSTHESAFNAVARYDAKTLTLTAQNFAAAPKLRA